MTQHITQAQWQHFWAEGYVRMGQVASDEEFATLQQRINDIMLGKAPVDYDQMMMQLDREPGTGKPGPQSTGHKGPTLLYRKIQQLEFDPIFLSYMQKSLFREVCAKLYGEATPIACFRAMFMNKPAREGTYLVWHQDRWTDLDRDPKITIYTALDPATVENGCVHIIPQSHQTLINPSHGSGFLAQEQIDEIVAKSKPVPLELAAGEVVLLHNWLLHSSGTNHTDIPRRAFSICYMPAATKSLQGHTFSLIFGEGALSVKQLSGNQGNMNVP
ncbi:phytanoyl-CoA dioxygenase family protein [Candidatus Poribacteria bacterium]|nr:phytanoyl-CoA dioxygenase family protein [Candidatus Poribacteria bacterium]